MGAPSGLRGGAGDDGGARRQLVREALFSRTGHFAPALLGTGAACAFLASVANVPGTGILAGLLAAAAALVVLLREVARTRADPARTTGTVVGVLLAAVLAVQPFVGTVPAFLVRAFGPRAFGAPITWVASVATAILLGPPLVAGAPSLVVLNVRAMREGALGARLRVALWLLGLAAVPTELEGDRNRVRAALAWISAVLAAWIGYTAWRGI